MVTFLLRQLDAEFVVQLGTGRVEDEVTLAAKTLRYPFVPARAGAAAAERAAAAWASGRLIGSPTHELALTEGSLLSGAAIARTPGFIAAAFFSDNQGLTTKLPPELALKITSSPDVGTAAPPAPPERLS